MRARRLFLVSRVRSLHSRPESRLKSRCPWLGTWPGRQTWCRPGHDDGRNQLVIAGLVPAISLRRAGREKSPAEAGPGRDIADRFSSCSSQACCSGLTYPTSKTKSRFEPASRTTSRRSSSYRSTEACCYRCSLVGGIRFVRCSCLSDGFCPCRSFAGQRRSALVPVHWFVRSARRRGLPRGRRGARALCRA